MPIQANCPGCNRRLEVDDSYAGRSARCPLCGGIYTVPGEPAAVAKAPIVPAHAPETMAVRAELHSPPIASAAGAYSESSSWFLRTPEGQTYGPVGKPTLDAWVAQGRVTHDCTLRAEETSVWHGAGAIYPVLRPIEFGAPYIANHTPAAGPASPASPAHHDREEGTSRSFTASHRGGLILGLGIAGFVVWFICPMLSIMAWVMGSSDLREMEAGRMDRDGMPLTRAGYMLGMIMSIGWIGGAVILVFVFLIRAASGF